MSRLLSTLRLDATVQFRNNLYYIGLSVGLLCGFLLWQFFNPDTLGTAIPIFFLFTIGGSTLLYVIGMLIFEKDEGTLYAVIVSPLRLDEYLMSKVISLSVLATLEAFIIVSIAYGLTGYNPLLLFGGILLMGGMLVLVGIIITVPYDTITDALVPMLIVGVVMQFPFLYFVGIFESPLILLVPTTAPAMLTIGGFRPLAAWELVYGLGYSLLTFGVLYWWARRAFVKHIIIAA